MLQAIPTLEGLWKAPPFEPNLQQLKAVKDIGGPPFLSLGLGSATARILLGGLIHQIVNEGEMSNETRAFVFAVNILGTHTRIHPIASHDAVLSSRRKRLLCQ